MPSRYFAWIALLFLFALRAAAQQPQAPRPPQAPSISSPLGGEDEVRAHLEAEMAKKANKERMASLKSDTDKLLKLSVELKNSVDKSDENVLSLDVIKKAEEIEKLAKSVKEKMKGPN